MVESDCTMLIAFDKGVPPKDSEIQTKLESSKARRLVCLVCLGSCRALTADKPSALS